MRLRVPVLTLLICSACTSVPEASRPAPVAPSDVPAVATQESIAPAKGVGLSDLDAMTFRCPQAGLNAAAREAAKVPAQGRYQFAYYKIVADGHHSAYEVHFKSNYQGEADLRYCVSVYCQQGQDPDTATSVSLIGDGPRPTKASAMGAAHGSGCGHEQTRTKRQSKKR